MDAIFNRRSIRSYLDKKIEDDKVDKLIRAGMQAPSAMNGQPWEFLVVQEKDTLKKLGEMSMFSKMVGGAPLAIVLLGNAKKMRAKAFFPQDMGAASENILLEATYLGLGGVWLGVNSISEREKFVREIFKLPEEIMPFGIIVIGYPGAGQENKFVDRYNPEKVHYEKY